MKDSEIAHDAIVRSDQENISLLTPDDILPQNVIAGGPDDWEDYGETMNQRTKDNNRSAKPRANFNLSQTRVSSLVLQGALFGFVGALVGYVVWHIVVYG